MSLEKHERILLVGAKLKALRIKAGYKNSELFANENELPRVQYWRMERGTNCTIKSLLRVLKVHKVSLSEFFKYIN